MSDEPSVLVVKIVMQKLSKLYTKARRDAVCSSYLAQTQCFCLALDALIWETVVVKQHDRFRLR